MSYHLVESKKKIIALSFFAVLFLSVGLASAEITEINTTCSMWDCETYLLVEGCTGQPLDKVEKRFEKTADIKNIDAKAVKGSDDLLYVFGSVKGATQNKWSISIGSCVLDPWWNSSWNVMRKITFNNTGINENLTNFPVLVKLNSGNFNYSKAQANGEDLRFIDEDNSTILPYEIELWNTTGDSNVWVNVLQIDSDSDTDNMWMYYNNSEASAGQNITGTWNNDYVVVLHLGEPSGDSLDSTSYDNDAYHYNSPTRAVSGAIGNAIDYETDNDEWSEVADSSSLNFDSKTFTVEFWMKRESHTAWMFYLSKWWWSTGDNRELMFAGDTATHIHSIITSTGTDAGNIVTDSSDFVANGMLISTALSFNSSHQILYVNGTINGTTANILGTNGDRVANISIGAQDTGANTFDGILDEIRISNTTRSDDWLLATFKTQTDDYLTIGEEEELPPVPILTLICIQYFLEKNIYISFCNVTAITHNQNYCLDNATLVHNITYTINETDGQFESSEHCTYGCNSESLECNPNPTQVNLWIIAGIIGFLIVLGILLKIFKLI